jgi:hypothetical protein
MEQQLPDHTGRRRQNDRRCRVFQARGMIVFLHNPVKVTAKSKQFDA